MPKIIPLRELKNASKVSELCHSESAPVFVTKNGAADLVIMTSDAYDKLFKPAITYSFSEKQTPAVAESSSLLAYMDSRDNKPLYSIFEIKETLTPVFKRHKVKKVTLFGSYVKGTADTRSDIDLMVETDLKGLAFYELLGDVSDALRFPVDLIEKRQIEKGSDMEAEIKRTGVIIYG